MTSLKIADLQRDAREEGISIGMERGISVGMERGMERGISVGMERGMERGREEGISVGIEQGAYEKAMETARTFLSMGLPLEQVAQGTGLPIETVQELTKK